ncbi:MAG: hypothetical protein CL908_07010 [Deltaproteobacteria bacterium]|nr:hypothetical protein [Deltaproteobacteria bacterium]
MSDPSTHDLPFPSFAPYPDRDSEPYWAALAEGSFQLQRCDECSALRWPPRALCNRCHSFESHWEDVARTGRIVSWTRTHQVFAPDCRDKVPYLVVQVALEEQNDILLIGGWLAERTPGVNERVRMKLVEAADGLRLPCWQPEDGV